METQASYEKVEHLLADSPQKAIEMLEAIVQRKIEMDNEESIKEQEAAILKLGSLYSKHGKAEDSPSFAASKSLQAPDLLAPKSNFGMCNSALVLQHPQQRTKMVISCKKKLSRLVRMTRPFLKCISKAKAAKMVRDLVDLFLLIDAESNNAAVQLCLECIDWATEEKRSFLRQALEARLIALYIDKHEYEEALTLSARLLKELKKLDDKALLVEVQLNESKAYHALDNVPRSRAALTSARTTANAIYCPPNLQASLDLQSGILHAEENDFKTAYSYFYEAFEGYDSIESPKAITALKYMLLSKIMLSCPDDVQSIVSGKLALRYAGSQIDAMKSIATASQHRSLLECQSTLNKYKTELSADPVIRRHIDKLYDNLLEQNLCRIIEPFSQVEVAHIALIIRLPLATVEKKLSQMILDKKLNDVVDVMLDLLVELHKLCIFEGILDQGSGVLIIFDGSPVDKAYQNSLEIIQNMGKVVDALYNKAKKLS